jgi:hypothetical protein
MAKTSSTNSTIAVPRALVNAAGALLPSLREDPDVILNGVQMSTPNHVFAYVFRKELPGLCQAAGISVADAFAFDRTADDAEGSDEDSAAE